jgi:CBS domain-containing protein
MRWLRRGPGKRQSPVDDGRQRELLQEVRQRFGGQVPAPFAAQAEAVVQLLGGDGDAGLAVAAEVLREFAEGAQTELLTQVADLHRRTGRGYLVDRRNYRPLWRDAGPGLRWSLFVLPNGLHPYVQVSAAVTVIGAQAKQAVRVTTPEALLAHVFETLDLIIAGWEYGRVRVDADAATLAGRLIATARDLRAAMSAPPPLPEPVRELMRRNNTVDVYDPAGTRVIGGFNPGKTMREALLA